MIYSSKHRFLFFANAKTGTTSVEEALRVYAESIPFDYDFAFFVKHIPPRFVKEKMPDDLWNSFFKFSFVRNPWDWVLGKWAGPYYSEEGECLKFKGRDFERVWNHIKSFRRGTHPVNRFQLAFLRDSEDNFLPDFVGRFERLQEDFDTACEKIGIPKVRLPHLNARDASQKPHHHYSKFYTEETRDLVFLHFRRDIEYFGYTFEQLLVHSPGPDPMTCSK